MLRELSLSHFRSHRAVKLALDGRPVALFGPNGAGKTNLLEAVSLLSPGRGMRRAGPQDMARRPEALGWKVAALAQGLGQTHEVATFFEGGVGREVRLDGKAVPQATLGRILRVLWLVPAMDRLWLDAPEARRRFLDRITLSFQPDHGEAVLGYEKAMRERNRLLKDMATDGLWYGALEAQMGRFGALVAENRRGALARLAQAQAGAETAFPAAALALVAPEGDMVEAEADLVAALAAGRRRDLAAGRSLAGPHRVDLTAVYAAKGVAAAECSTGEQKALLISLILANARALAEDFGMPPVLLLDEVAAHLDASRRAALYHEICAMGAQAFLTGTGAELFDTLAGRAAMYEVTESAGLSSVREVGA